MCVCVRVCVCVSVCVCMCVCVRACVVCVCAIDQLLGSPCKPTSLLQQYISDVVRVGAGASG